MSDISKSIDFLRMILDAIIQGRIEARQLRDMSEEQLAEYHARLVEDEKAEIERGKSLMEPDPSE